MRKRYCPVCKESQDSDTTGVALVTGETEKEDPGPRPGDFTLCINCESVLRYDKDTILYEPSPLELVPFKAVLKMYQDALKMTKNKEVIEKYKL